MTHLGWRYDTGTGVKTDAREAAAWYRQAAEHGGHSMAQNNLGCLYRDGRGVIQDYKTASTLFRMAAEQGNNHARTNLAGCTNAAMVCCWTTAKHCNFTPAQEYRDFETGCNTRGIRWPKIIWAVSTVTGHRDAFTCGEVVPQISRSRQPSRPP